MRIKPRKPSLMICLPNRKPITRIIDDNMNPLRQSIAWSVVFLLCSCEKKPETHENKGERIPRTAVEVSQHDAGNYLTHQKRPPYTDDILPTDARLAVNSRRIAESQRAALRGNPPAGYNIHPPFVPKFAFGMDQNISWRKDGSFHQFASSKEYLARLLGIREEQIPDGCFEGAFVSQSPSNRRVMSSGSDDDTWFFDSKDGSIDISSKKRFPV
jgi:hypothetical protein